MKVIGYARRSQDRGNGYGLDAQEAKLRAWAKYRDAELVEVIREDDVSGRVPPEDRSGLSDALRRIEGGEADALVFAKLDRLARSVAVFSRLMRRSRDEGWGIICLDPEFDTGTAAGRLVAHVFASVGEWELENTVERLQGGRAAKAAKGLWTGGKPPFGYRVEGDRLIPDPSQQETIQRLIALRKEGRTWQQVAEALGGKLHPNTCKKIYRRETGESGGRVHKAKEEA